MQSNEIHSLESLRTEKELGISYNIDKITDNIYLGGVKGLSESDYFKTEKITATLSILKEAPKFVDDENIKHISLFYYDEEGDQIVFQNEDDYKLFQENESLEDKTIEYKEKVL